jgi:NADPH-dependent glutamate synthase beta subunit-like oxidoreductase
MTENLLAIDVNKEVSLLNILITNNPAMLPKIAESKRTLVLGTRYMSMKITKAKMRLGAMEVTTTDHRPKVTPIRLRYQEVRMDCALTYAASNKVATIRNEI